MALAHAAPSLCTAALRNADEPACPDLLREPSVNGDFCGEVVLN